MQVLYPRCCGLDIHKRSIVACVLADTAAGSVDREVRSFGTTTRELQALVTWLQTWDCPIVGHGKHRRLLAADLQGPVPTSLSFTAI